MSISLPNSTKGPSGEKTSPEYYAIHTNNGSIELGKLKLASPSSDNLNASVTTGVHLQAKDALHYMAMENDGPRQGWTLNRSPGPYQILCATNTSAKSPSEENGFGFVLYAENGDVVISAPKGRIRLSALDIDIRAEGYDNKTGTINLDANQSVNIDAPRFNAKTSVGVRISSTSNISIVANGTLKYIGNFQEGLTAASSVTSTPVNASGLANFLLNQG